MKLINMFHYLAGETD